MWFRSLREAGERLGDRRQGESYTHMLAYRASDRRGLEGEQLLQREHAHLVHEREQAVLRRLDADDERQHELLHHVQEHLRRGRLALARLDCSFPLFLALFCALLAHGGSWSLGTVWLWKT
jgi:hypothetical protein